MNKTREYPKPDRHKFIPERYRDAGYCEGTLSDGRPFRMEYWFESGHTYLSIFISAMGIEDATNEMLKAFLVGEHLIEFDDAKFHSSGFSGCNVDSRKIMDGSGNEMWEITVIVGDEDGTYVHYSMSMRKYEFPYEADKPLKEFFIALCKEEVGTADRPYQMYASYFVNDSDDPIELMVDGETEEHRNIPPRSFVRLKGHFYHEWEFDFPNKINLYIKTDKKEMRIGFLMKKYFIAWNEEEIIPVLKRSGWICR